MNYDEALAFIHDTLKFGIKLGLDNIRYLLKLMGNPQDKLKYIHIAGTNGKGSTSSFINSILMEAGYRTGLYTSPYLERFTERIKVDNREIEKDELAAITGFVKSKVEQMVAEGYKHPTEFEIVTAAGFQYFYEQKCDVVVLEVGLGGRFDSTNVILKPLVSVITSISMDHTDKLGNTLAEIAYEKAGIIKHGGCVVNYPQAREADAVIRRTALDRYCSITDVNPEAVRHVKSDINGQVFDFEGYCGLSIGLLGEHQLLNAATAVKTAEQLNGRGFIIDEDAIRKGISKAFWPGRFEILRKEPYFILDGAHNIQGAEVLADALARYFSANKKILIMGVFKDKDYAGIARELGSIADEIIVVKPNSDRAMESNELADFLKNYCKNITISDTINHAIEKSLLISNTNDVICACGSLYLIGEIRSTFNGNYL